MLSRIKTMLGLENPLVLPTLPLSDEEWRREQRSNQDHLNGLVRDFEDQLIQKRLAKEITFEETPLLAPEKTVVELTKEPKEETNGFLVFFSSLWRKITSLALHIMNALTRTEDANPSVPVITQSSPARSITALSEPPPPSQPAPAAVVDIDDHEDRKVKPKKATKKAPQDLFKKFKKPASPIKDTPASKRGFNIHD